MSRKKCPGCEGKGKYKGFNVIVEDPCEVCEGKGYIYVEDDGNEPDTEEIEPDFFAVDDGDDSFLTTEEILDALSGSGFID